MAKNNRKLPKRTDGGCQGGPLGTIICRPTTTGLLKARHMKLVGKGRVVIPAEIARAIVKMYDNLKPDHMLASAESVRDLVIAQLCTWCDGMGWHLANMGESAIACSHCVGTGLEPVLKEGRTCSHKRRTVTSGTWNDKHVVIPKCLDCGWIRPSAKRWIRVPKDPDEKK